ncbi:MAG: hypothetical protein LQ340_002745 [Diploschistes diacapsis]|nr:MAG: hypothetical protein LQ340_002745 [Diploschistes diacapsis]
MDPFMLSDQPSDWQDDSDFWAEMLKGDFADQMLSSDFPPSMQHGFLDPLDSTSQIDLAEASSSSHSFERAVCCCMQGHAARSAQRSGTENEMQLGERADVNSLNNFELDDSQPRRLLALENEVKALKATLESTQTTIRRLQNYIKEVQPWIVEVAEVVRGRKPTAGV